MVLIMQSGRVVGAVDMVGRDVERDEESKSEVKKKTYPESKDADSLGSR